MKSYFITGTDTNIGKTIISAGLARGFQKLGMDVGIMKPFAAGEKQKSGFKSSDVTLLANAAKIDDPENLLNPQFFEMPASPYTASKKLGTKVDLDLVFRCFQKLSRLHKIMLVEGMGGIMTPILKNYCITNLIKDMNLETIIITSSKMGTINHTLMTCRICLDFGLKIRGLIINELDSSGYSIPVLKDDLEDLTGLKVLGSMPFIEDLSIDNISSKIQEGIDLNSLIY